MGYIHPVYRVYDVLRVCVHGRHQGTHLAFGDAQVSPMVNLLAVGYKTEAASDRT
jgi:hypothetical protein